MRMNTEKDSVVVSIGAALDLLYAFENKKLIVIPPYLPRSVYNERAHFMAKVAGYKCWDADLFSNPKTLNVAEAIQGPYGLVMVKAWLSQLKDKE